MWRRSMYSCTIILESWSTQFVDQHEKFIVNAKENINKIFPWDWTLFSLLELLFYCYNSTRNIKMCCNVPDYTVVSYWATNPLPSKVNIILIFWSHRLGEILLLLLCWNSGNLNSYLVGFILSVGTNNICFLNIWYSDIKSANCLAQIPSIAHHHSCCYRSQFFLSHLKN